LQRKQAKNGIAMTVAACLWLGLFPLLQGFTYTRITLDKWLFMLALCGVTLVCSCVDLVSARRIGNRVSPGSGPFPRLPLILGGFLLLWVVLSCLLSPYGADTWWIGASMRREGLATQLCYLGIFFCFIFGRVSLKPVLFAACGGVVLFAVVVVLQRHGGNPLGLYPAGRSFAANPEFQGTIGNIDMDTGYLCLLSGLFLHGGIRQFQIFRQDRCRSALAALVCCAAGLGISVFLILTMQVQFGVITLAVLLLFTALRLLPKKGRLAALILVLVLALLVSWFWPGTGGGLWELHEILHGRTRLSFGSNRVAVWLWSLQLAREQLLFGSGSDTFVLRFNQYLEDHGLTIPNEQDGVALPDYFDNPHNEYLAQLLNHGLPAMLLLIILMISSVMRKREGLFPLLTPCSAAVLCYAVQGFFSFPVCLVSPMFWVLLGTSFQSDQNY
jgi:hypothetical protein